MEHKIQKQITVMLKPVSGECNMRCKYCFYADETAKRSIPDFGHMTQQTLAGVLQHVLDAATESCTIIFQGGEPTLAGLNFFRAAVQIAAQENTHHSELHFALQTNGQLLDADWCRFFAQKHFLIGVSLDGTKPIHDAYRVDAAGAGSYHRTLHALQLLRQYRVDHNLLTVLTPEACRNYGKIYGFYSRNGWDFQQYIPCLDPYGEPRGKRPWSLKPEQMEHYLKTAFDLWYMDAMHGKKHFHRYFDNLLLILDGRSPEACGMGGQCSQQYVVESDGSTYPCDFYMMDAYRLGNLAFQTIAEIDAARERLGFIEQSRRIEPQCASCPWVQLCRGGCRRDRDYFTKELGLNYYCSAYRAFFEYSYPRLCQVYEHELGRNVKGG